MYSTTKKHRRSWIDIWDRYLGYEYMSFNIYCTVLQES